MMQNFRAQSLVLSLLGFVAIVGLALFGGKGEVRTTKPYPTPWALASLPGTPSRKERFA